MVGSGCKNHPLPRRGGQFSSGSTPRMQRSGTKWPGNIIVLVLIGVTPATPRRQRIQLNHTKHPTIPDPHVAPSPVLPKQQQDCQELLPASSRSSHCLSCFHASSVTLGPSSLLENANPSESMLSLANLPHVSTWTVEEAGRASPPDEGTRAKEGGWSRRT